ncbi:uncharacterized protein BCR38DRAFT_441332 [Pseudomassariella vexata]|uniref:Ketopantoate reductase C-terminal domain-containing protein n=1 Tax=Pseudomassariella vexata TaxID=1141098 RepID=A0A1Y2DMX4_9PEZI|nr:uncharacterized protein BCR38DRAFT_441332 [Pseudomassariella vexata]ORY60519.1 hypothetical protein BCR38DRAFT_441332 [Pseudomassariella vexata]
MYSPPSMKWTRNTPNTSTNIPFYRPPPVVLPPDIREESRPAEKVRMTLPAEGSEEYQEVLASLRLSDKIHIMGFTREARYITYCLAGTPELPPAQLLAQHPNILTKWGREGRQLTVYTPKGPMPSRDVIMPKYIGPPRGTSRNATEFTRLQHISNLLISTFDGSIYTTLLHMRDYIDQDTTICLLNEGLGVVEHLNEGIFTDPDTRPNYVLGHVDYMLATKRQIGDFSMDLKAPGKMYLTALPRESPGESLVSTRPRVVGRARAQHLIKLLCQTPGLDAGGFPMSLFLRQKLPSMVFSSLTDAISVALGCQYDRISTSPYAVGLWHDLLDETVTVIASLPEFKEHPDALEYFTGRRFKDDLFAKLRNKRGASTWIARVRTGMQLPMPYLNGWFVKKAKENGVPHSAHNTLMSMVRTRHEARMEELKGQIPMYVYKTDGDLTNPDEDGQNMVPIRYVYITKNK